MLWVGSATSSEGDLPSGSVGRECACKAGEGDTGDAGSILWVGKIPWRRPWQPTSVFSPGESRGQRSLAGYSLWGRNESDTTEDKQCSTSVNPVRMVRKQHIQKNEDSDHLQNNFMPPIYSVIIKVCSSFVPSSTTLKKSDHSLLEYVTRECPRTTL